MNYLVASTTPAWVRHDRRQRNTAHVATQGGGSGGGGSGGSGENRCRESRVAAGKTVEKKARRNCFTGSLEPANILAKGIGIASCSEIGTTVLVSEEEVTDMSPCLTLARPAEFGQLQPFATILESVLVPTAERLEGTGLMTKPPLIELEGISREIASHCEATLNPTVWIGALMRCTSFYQRSIRMIGDPDEEETQQGILDSAYALLALLAHHHGVEQPRATL